MMRKKYWLVFLLVFLWKTVLLVFTAQPVPANDAFFYDGGVVHYLLQGGYYNPPLALALPISGREIYSTYPPLYQGILLLWLSLFGISAWSVMWLHLVLFGVYLLIVLAILRELQVPAWWINLAGVFLLVLTFHDRPDSLAHCWGMLAVYAGVRSWRPAGTNPQSNSALWAWAMALFGVLALSSSLQIGGVYAGVIFTAALAAGWAGVRRIPILPLACLVFVPIALALAVKLSLPRAWAGFQEHLHATPSLTGLRLPPVADWLKIARTVPGVLLMAVLLPALWRKSPIPLASDVVKRQGAILIALLLAALGVAAASLSVLTPNMIGIAAYLQPLLVALYLTLAERAFAGQGRLRRQVACFGLAMALGAVRAVGMTTWGVACATDVSYAQATAMVDRELDGHPAGYKVMLSSALLYNAARHTQLDLIHSDWVMPPHRDGGPAAFARALMALKPEKIILTQFDYYRQFEALLTACQRTPGFAQIEVVNTAHLRPPDSYRRLQKVVQHISWAPVIVTLTWQKDP